jgi:hypothetical protein
MKRAILIIRAMNAEGRHLSNCFASREKQAEGVRLIYRAKRIAHRLGYKLAALVPVLLLLASLQVNAACPPGFPEKMADVIYKAEGGSKTKWPYGVKSVKVKDAAEARRVTINSVKNNWRRWEKAGKPGGFIPFMAARWCPVAADPVGNKNWTANVTRLMGKDAL